MFSIPVAIIGALLALALTHQTINLFSAIGLIMLFGLVAKNGILLVDYANTLRKRGLDELEAIKESAHTRFRPIVMTSFSVVAGNIPLALALEPASAGVTSATTAAAFGALAVRVYPAPAAYVHPGLVLAAVCWLAACSVPLVFIDAAVHRLPDAAPVPAYAGDPARRRQRRRVRSQPDGRPQASRRGQGRDRTGPRAGAGA